LESLVGKLARGLVVLHHFVVEHREVEGKSEFDGVARGQLNLVSLLVGGQGFLLHFLELVALGVLGDVAVVITDHLDEEGLGLVNAVLGEHLSLDH
jgi:hypothetical protein